MKEAHYVKKGGLFEMFVDVAARGVFIRMKSDHGYCPPHSGPVEVLVMPHHGLLSGAFGLCAPSTKLFGRRALSDFVGS